MDFKEAMLRAIELAKRGTGHVSPNPRVGAVILDENRKIIGEGWHKKFGGPHAEVEAINHANRKIFEGCTIVITLEPCTHFGKTPPCTELIIKSKFSKVVIGTLDKNPLVRGKGVELLTNVGIEVISGVEEEKCIYINRAFFKFIETGLPYVILKVAQSFDGNIALENGESQWITSPESRTKVQLLRANCDAILVGTNTLIADNPSLNVREFDLPSPKRIVLNGNLKLPIELNVFKNTNQTQTIVFFNQENPEKLKQLKELGVFTEKVNLNEYGKINLKEVLKILGEKYKITSLLVEGGSHIYSSFLSEKLVDEIHFFIAPKIIGKGLKSFGQIRLEKLDNAFEFEVKKMEQVGVDYYFETLVKKM